MSKQNHGAKRSFVIQKHDASQLHYDFRLEMSDAEFEGVIPEGEYGAHQVELSHTDKVFFQAADNASVAMQVGPRHELNLPALGEVDDA